jgi:predicted nucleic acid-binding protein
MQLVDANIFIRYLTRDDSVKAAACYRLLEQAKNNQVALTTSEAVIAEVVFVLSSKRLYHLSPQDVRIRLYPVLSLPGLKLTHRRQILRALDLFSSNQIDFEDALSVAMMERQGISEIYSYDEDFDRIHGSTITRIEP